jgi:hypothetical protein
MSNFIESVDDSKIRTDFLLEKNKIEKKLLDFGSCIDDNQLHVICCSNLKVNNYVICKELIDLLKYKMIDKNILICIVSNNVKILTGIVKVNLEFISLIEEYLMEYNDTYELCSYNINDLKNDILTNSGLFNNLMIYQKIIYFII